MIQSIPQVKITFLLILTVLTTLIFAILWYTEKQPTLWILFSAIALSSIVIIGQCMNIIFITIFVTKKPEIRNKENDRNKKYKFIKGLY